MSVRDVTAAATRSVKPRVSAFTPRRFRTSWIVSMTHSSSSRFRRSGGLAHEDYCPQMRHFGSRCLVFVAIDKRSSAQIESPSPAELFNKGVIDSNVVLQAGLASCVIASLFGLVGAARARASGSLWRDACSRFSDHYGDLTTSSRFG